MPVFTYIGRAKNGQKVAGDLDGATKELVAKQLQRSGIVPLKIKTKTLSQVKENTIASVDIGLSANKKLTPDDLIFFSRQMYTLIKAGVPLIKALDGLSTTTDNKQLAVTIRGLREALDEGLDLTGAMRKQPNVFSDLYINLVRIGETTGKLSEIFEELAHYLQKEKETRQKVKSALSYPLTVISIVGIGLVIVNIFVLPAFAEMFSSFNAELPLPTRILIGFSEFTSAYSYHIVGVILAILLAIRYYLNSPQGKFQWHQQQYSLPLVGKLLKQNSISRFARTLSITSRAGVPIEQALQIIAPAIGNLFMQKKVESMRAFVERGESITNAIVHTGVFPGMVVQMISVGEEAGTLDEMVAEVSDYYDREIDQAVKTLTAAIEPLIVIFIAAIVLVLALGIFLPMISLMGAMN